MHGKEWVVAPAGRTIGRDITDELRQFLFTDEHKGHYVIAHNFGVSLFLALTSISFLILMNEIFSGIRRLLDSKMVTERLNPNIIMSGGRIMAMNVKEQFGIKFRDSLHYNPQALE